MPFTMKTLSNRLSVSVARRGGDNKSIPYRRYIWFFFLCSVGFAFESSIADTEEPRLLIRGHCHTSRITGIFTVNGDIYTSSHDKTLRSWGENLEQKAVFSLPVGQGLRGAINRASHCEANGVTALATARVVSSNAGQSEGLGYTSLMFWTGVFFAIGLHMMSLFRP